MEIKAYDIGTKVYIIGIKHEDRKRDWFDTIGEGIIYKVLIDSNGTHYGISENINSIPIKYYDEQVVFNDKKNATIASMYYNENYEKITLDKSKGDTKDED